MITHVKGKLVEKNPTYVVVECLGIGYHINISLTTYEQIKDEENIFLYTHLQIKEDSHSLFGFFEISERSIFKLLISVSGVGPSVARTMLSSLSSNEIKTAISSNDIEKIKSIKGIGLKTAQRLIIELKDKILNIHVSNEFKVIKNNTIKEETLSALEVLGYTRKSSQKVVDNLIQGNPDSTIEDLIKGALNKL